MYNLTDVDWRSYVNMPQLPTGQSVSRGTRKPRARAPGQVTRDELRVMVAATGLKWTTKHTKAELSAMLKHGVQVRAAAQDRENERRRLARAAKALEA